MIKIHIEPSTMTYYHILYLCSLLFLTQILSTLCQDPKHEWDLLIFTQRWPLTACSEWEEANKANTCTFPDPQDLWTIHGIWPTKAGTIGPQNCNKTWHFNETIIDPIKVELEQYWVNVEKNTKLTSLWSHEWNKHGTCAAVLPQLDNELKYFQQGLTWIKQYNMKDILTGQKVLPNDTGYPVEMIFESVQTALGKSAIIQCVVDRRTKQSLISEIRICFNKSLELMDCDAVKGRDHKRIGKVLTNCNPKKLVVYPSKLVPVNATKSPGSFMDDEDVESSTVSTLEQLYDAREKIISIYRTIKLLMWATI